jgi:hypothetical protein
MWLNIKWFDANGGLIREDGAYGGLNVFIPNPAGGPDVEVESIINLDDSNLVIYDAHYAMTQGWADTLLAIGKPTEFALSYDRITGAVDFTLGELAALPADSHHETFHFVLNNYVSKDERIPPYGMRYDIAKERNALPVPAEQYEYDLTNLGPANAESAQIDLLYQGTSWEYIQFLNNNNTGQNAFLGEEGVNMLEAWINAEVPGAMPVGGDRKMVPPYVMKSVTWGTVTGNTPPVAANDSYVVDEDTLLTVPAPGVLGNDSDAEGDTLTAELVSGVSNGSLSLAGDGSFTYTPAPGFSGSDSFVYRTLDSQSAASNDATVTITVTAVGGGSTAGVDAITTGLVTGKGKSQTFTPTSLFTQGDTVVLQMFVLDHLGGPVEGATVSIDISQQEANLTSSVSGADGFVEASWRTSAPNRKGQGGTAPGAYTATVVDVIATGYTWNGVATSADFSVSE